MLRNGMALRMPGHLGEEKAVNRRSVGALALMIGFSIAASKSCWAAMTAEVSYKGTRTYVYPDFGGGDVAIRYGGVPVAGCKDGCG